MLETRKQVRELEREALKRASEIVNQDWIKLYLNLAHILNILDAFIARSEEKE